MRKLKWWTSGVNVALPVSSQSFNSIATVNSRRMSLNASPKKNLKRANSFVFEESRFTTIQCLVLGPSSVGKSWLLQRIIEGDLAFSVLDPTWPDARRHSAASHKDETCLECKCITITCNSERYKIDLYEDTWKGIAERTEDEKGFSKSLVNQSHVIAICFSLNDEKSLEEILTSDFPLLIDWLDGKELPLILLGLKLDCKKVKNLSRIGNKVAKQIGASYYVECSALTTENVYHIPELIVTAWTSCAFNSKNQKPHRFKRCNVL